MVKQKETKKMTQEDWEAERTRLSDEVKKAQQALWDFCHPVIEDPQVVAQQEAWATRKKATK
jgi:hypothetical protein